MTEPGKISPGLLAEIDSWRVAFGRVDAVIGRELLRTAAEQLWRALAADAALRRDPPIYARALHAVVDALTEYARLPVFRPTMSRPSSTRRARRRPRRLPPRQRARRASESRASKVSRRTPMRRGLRNVRSTVAANIAAICSIS